MRVSDDFRPRILDEFKRMMEGLNQNYEHLSGWPDDMARRVIGATRAMGRHRREPIWRVVKTFLDELLAKPRTLDELLGVWGSTPVEIMPGKDGTPAETERSLRAFFPALRDRLAASLQSRDGE